MPTEKQSISNKKLSIIILAAGEGKRMHLKTPKVLQKILGKPIILFVVELAENIKTDETIIVVGKNAKEIKTVIGNRVKYAVQSVPRGTGDASKKGIEISTNNNVLILCGDVPLLQKDTILKLLQYHNKTKADLTFLSCHMKNPFGYGRIIRDENKNVLGIVEQADATIEEQKIKEMNAGVYYGKKTLILSALNKITKQNRQGEYYLTDVVGEMLKKREKVVALKIHNEKEIMGINSKSDLIKARKIAKDNKPRRTFTSQQHKKMKTNTGCLKY